MEQKSLFLRPMDLGFLGLFKHITRSTFLLQRRDDSYSKLPCPSTLLRANGERNGVKSNHALLDLLE